MSLVTLPNIPEDTARGARHLYGMGNLYIQLGEQVNQLLKEISPSNMEIQNRRSAEAETRFALITSFQYVEELTDHQLLDALRNRVDLKYALHMPLDYIHIESQALCQFRQQILHDQPALNTFQALLDRLFADGFLNTNKEQIASAQEVLELVCTSTRIEKVLEAMDQALEALALRYGDWLRTVALPIWYERYGSKKRMLFWPNGKGEWKSNMVRVGKDIRYLLELACSTNQPEIASLLEIRKLGKVLDEQYEVVPGEASPEVDIQWRARGCTSCTNLSPSAKEVA